MKKILFFILIMFCINCYSQQRNDLYLITGHPYINSEQQFESVLWGYNPDSLDLVKVEQLSTSDENLLNIKLYNTHGYFSLMKQNSWRQEIPYDSLLIFDIKKMELIRLTININEHHFTPFDNNLLLSFIDEAKRIAINLISNSKPIELHYVGLNLSDFNIDTLSLDIFKNLYLVGEPGGNVEGGDYILTYSNDIDGFLDIIVAEKRNLCPRFPYELPKKYRLNSYSMHLIAINNEINFVVSGEKKLLPNKIGTRQLLIYNKIENKWIERIIFGNLPRIRGFEEWICGYIADDNEDLRNKKKPGSDLWKDRATGLSPKIRFRKIYAPGILYLYNALTDVYLEINTGQADSEVVLVQDGIMLYRVYDELYKVEIIDGEKLGTPQLLIKDDRVPDIHWAFFSGKD